MAVLGCAKNCKLKKKTLIAKITVGDIILTLADIASDLNNGKYSKVILQYLAITL